MRTLDPPMGMRSGGLLAAVACLWLLLAGPGLVAQPAEGGAAVEQVRQNYRDIETGIQKGLYRQSRFTLGGGQNPTEYLVHYQGGSDADFEQDPYAAPFLLRRVSLRRVLPAVGPGGALFYFDSAGQLSFVFTQGADLCGTRLADIAPATEIRAYFAGDRMIRVIFKNLLSIPSELTWDDGSPVAPELQAKLDQVRDAFIRRAAELRQALGLLARLLSRWAAEQGHEVTSLTASAHTLSPCTGCMACVFRHPGRCKVADDLPAYLDALHAERLFLVGPVYFLTPAAGWKLLLDRMLVFRPAGEGEKHCGIFHLAGLANWSVADPLAALVGLAAGYRISGACTLTGPGPGHALLPGENLALARGLFDRVMAGEQEPRPGCCNVCLSMYVSRAQGLYCPLCDAWAGLDGRVPYELSRWHPRRLAQHYQEWVTGTRTLFLKDRPLIRRRLEELGLQD